MRPSLDMLARLPLLICLLSAPAAAQPFTQVARNATEIEDLSQFGAELFADCSNAACRREARRVRRTTWLASLPAQGNVELGPYEVVREGFMVRVPDLLIEANGGMLTTIPPENGALARHVLADRFFVSPPDRAARWFRRNSIERLRLRVVFRVGRNWETETRKGARIRALGIQIYNSSTGNVLVDTIQNPPAPPGGPIDLVERVMLWERAGLREARWRSPDGTPLLFSVRVDRGEGVRQPVLVETRGVTRRDVARFETPHETSTLAVLPRKTGQVLVIFTLRRPSDGDPGHGEVHVYEWREGALHRAAQWRGSNEDDPPTWVRDPSAPLPRN